MSPRSGSHQESDIKIWKFEFTVSSQFKVREMGRNLLHRLKNWSKEAHQLSGATNPSKMMESSC